MASGASVIHSHIQEVTLLLAKKYLSLIAYCMTILLLQRGKVILALQILALKYQHISLAIQLVLNLAR